MAREGFQGDTAITLARGDLQGDIMNSYACFSTYGESTISLLLFIGPNQILTFQVHFIPWSLLYHPVPPGLKRCHAEDMGPLYCFCFIALELKNRVTFKISHLVASTN